MHAQLPANLLFTWHLFAAPIRYTGTSLAALSQSCLKGADAARTAVTAAAAAAAGIDVVLAHIKRREDGDTGEDEDGYMFDDEDEIEEGEAAAPQYYADGTLRGKSMVRERRALSRCHCILFAALSAAAALLRRFVMIGSHHAVTTPHASCCGLQDSGGFAHVFHSLDVWESAAVRELCSCNTNDSICVAG